MDFFINLSKPRKLIFISKVTKCGTTDVGSISIENNFELEEFKIDNEKFRILPSYRRGCVNILGPNRIKCKMSYAEPVVCDTERATYQFMLRDELLNESAPKIPRFVKHSFGLHVLLFAIGVGLSLFQPKVPERIVFEVETQIIEKEVAVKPPEEKPVPAPEKPNVEKKIIAKAQPRSKPMPRKKVPIAMTPKHAPAKRAPIAPAPPAASAPNPVAQAAAAQKASVAKALNFMSAKTGGINAEPTVTANKKGSMYGVGSEQTLNAKNPSVLNKIGAKSQDGNITTKGSRMISSTNGVSGGLDKSLNNVQGRVSSSNLYNGGLVGASMDASGLNLSGDGSIAQSLIEKALAKHLDKLRYCYEKALLSDASVGGNVLLQWTIVSSGNARDIRTLRSAINNSQMQNCINREIAKIDFPRPSGGEVIVKFPFNFTSNSI